MNNILKVLLEKKERMQEHVGNVNRNMETLRKNQKLLEITKQNNTK